MYTRAKKAGVARHSVLIVMLGLTASATLWAIGFGLSFSSDRPQSIARISLWSIGLAIEFLATAVSSAHSTALRIELEYWAERFAALTLIIIGEGIIGIYENFKSILDGFNLTRFANVFGSIFAAVGLYRILFGRLNILILGVFCLFERPADHHAYAYRIVLQTTHAPSPRRTAYALLLGPHPLSNAFGHLALHTMQVHLASTL